MNMQVLEVVIRRPGTNIYHPCFLLRMKKTTGEAILENAMEQAGRKYDMASSSVVAQMF